MLIFLSNDSLLGRKKKGSTTLDCYIFTLDVEERRKWRIYIYFCSNNKKKHSPLILFLWNHSSMYENCILFVFSSVIMRTSYFLSNVGTNSRFIRGMCLSLSTSSFWMVHPTCLYIRLVCVCTFQFGLKTTNQILYAKII